MGNIKDELDIVVYTPEEEQQALAEIHLERDLEVSELKRQLSEMRSDYEKLASSYARLYNRVYGNESST